jgi:hypothetical protein
MVGISATSAAVGLDGDVLGDRHPRGQLGLGRCDLAPVEQRAQQLRRGRRHELRRDLGTGHLGEHAGLAHDLTGGVRAQAGDGAPDDGGREGQERRRRHDRHAALDQQRRDPLLDGRLVRRVDQVDAPVG